VDEPTGWAGVFLHRHLGERGRHPWGWWPIASAWRRTKQDYTSSESWWEGPHAPLPSISRRCLSLAAWCRKHLTESTGEDRMPRRRSPHRRCSPPRPDGPGPIDPASTSGVPLDPLTLRQEAATSATLPRQAARPSPRRQGASRRPVVNDPSRFSQAQGLAPRPLGPSCMSGSPHPSRSSTIRSRPHASTPLADRAVDLGWRAGPGPGHRR